MKKTIKIIELLNMIANGEEVPKRIRVFGEEFELDSREYYSIHSSSPLESYFGQDYFSEELKYEVEILDEEEFEDIDIKFENANTTVELVQQILNKIRPLIRNQKKIIERLKSDK